MAWTWHGHEFRSEELRKRKHRLVKVTRSGAAQNQIAWLSCAAYGCKNLIRLRDITEHGRETCAACAARTIFGMRVRQDWVWDMRARIIGAKGVAGNRVFHVICPSEGCKNTTWIVSSKMRGWKCRQCKWAEKVVSPKFARHWWHLKNDATKRGIKVSITERQFVDLCAICQCFYCGKTFSRSARDVPGRFYTWAAHLDRLDSSGPYSLANVVTSCAVCNKRKGPHRSAQAFLVLLKLEQGKRHEAAQWCLAGQKGVAKAARAFTHKHLPQLFTDAKASH